jgi:hypothetical protein
LLDKAKAARAVAAYRKAMNDLCDALWLSPEGKPMRPQWDPNNYDVQRSAAPHSGDKEAGAKLQGIGLDRADDIPLCEKTDFSARPLASGSFTAGGADEVLLEVWNGAAALAPNTVALMRLDGKSYRLVTHLAIGNSPAGNRFDPKLRLMAPKRKDVLFLCEAGGMQGLYTGTCGFLGQGSFREPIKQQPTTANPSPEAPTDAARAEEIQFVDVQTCGPVTTVELGKVSARADRLLVDLVVVDAIAEHAAGEEDSAYCSRKTERKERRFTVEYKFDDGGYKRLAPIPADVTEALNKNQ